MNCRPSRAAGRPRSAERTPPATGRPPRFRAGRPTNRLCGRAQALRAQLAVVLVPLVCLEAIVGEGSLPSAGVAVSLRLFVSPVKPSLTHLGSTCVPSVMAVCASSVVLVPKFASPPPPSPNTPHSVVFQAEARSISLSLLVTVVAVPEPTDSDTALFLTEAALPESLTLARSAAVRGPPGVVAAELLV